MYLQAINSESPDSGMGDFPIDNQAICEQNATILKNQETVLILGDFMPSTENRFLTASEIAEIFQVSRDEIYKLARRGVISAYKIGGVWRFDLPEVKRDTLTKQKTTESD